MRLTMSITPEVFDRKDMFEIRATFESNLNLNTYTMVEVVPKQYDPDIRNRILDKMFYELRKKVDMESQALKDFLKT